jgi:hypothetical protein
MLTKRQNKTGALLAMLACTALTASAQINYLDATAGVSGNTALAAGGVFTPPLNGTTGLDNQWEQRTVFASSGTVFEVAGEGTAVTENAPRLVTTITGLASGTYDLYAYFWSPGTLTADNAQQWLLRAGLTDAPGELQLYSRVLGILPTPINPPGMIIASQVTSSAGFTLAPTIFTEGGRNLWQASLGQAVVTGGSVQIFIDDYAPAGSVNNRTWYDGVGYAVVPEPSSLALAVLGLMGALRFRRQAAA